MKRVPFTLLVPLALAACGTAATGYGGGTAPSSQSTPATISVHASSLGQILVDANGKTLYLFEADTSTQSTCSGACALAAAHDKRCAEGGRRLVTVVAGYDHAERRHHPSHVRRSPTLLLHQRHQAGRYDR